MTERAADRTHRLRLASRDCPYCGTPSGSNVVHRLRYSETLSAVAGIEDFDGWVDACSRCGIYMVNPRYDVAEFPRLYPALSAKTGSGLKRIAAVPTRLMIADWNARSAWRRAAARLAGALLEPIVQPPVPPDDFAGGRILDVGCGDGFHLRCYARLGCELHGTEVHPGYADALARGPERIRYRIADFADVDWTAELGDKRFDLILFQSVFYRLDDPLVALRLAWRLLGPGGTVVRIEPYCPDLEAIRFMTHFNFPQGFTFIREIPRYLATIEPHVPGARFRWKIFYGRSRKHRFGREMTVAQGAGDLVSRLLKNLVGREPWFIRLEMKKLS
jgi:SAM-dependent methyltransferase